MMDQIICQKQPILHKNSKEATEIITEAGGLSSHSKDIIHFTPHTHDKLGLYKVTVDPIRHGVKMELSHSAGVEV